MRFRARAWPQSSAGELRGSAVYPCTPFGLPEDKSTLATIMSGGYDEHTFCHLKGHLSPRSDTAQSAPATAGAHASLGRKALPPSPRAAPLKGSGRHSTLRPHCWRKTCPRLSHATASSDTARAAARAMADSRARGGPAAPSARAGRALRPHRQQRHGAKARHEHGQLERVVARLAQLARDDLHERHVQERACSAVHIAQHPYDTEHMPGDWHLTRNGAGDYQGVTQLSTYDTEHPCIVVGTCLQTRREAIRVYCGTDQHGYQRATVMTPFCCQTHTQ